MSDILKKHIEKFIAVNEQDYANILSYFQPLKVAKKQNLLVEGKVCKSNYFVEKGCLRLFFINEKGVEQTIQFALEHWWMADFTSFSTQQPSEYYIQAVETSGVLALEYAAQEEMLQRFPQMERYFRLVHQRAHAAYQFRIRGLYYLSREELFHQFNEKYPEFVQRVPQYLLASFLGFTPEYLSEIRRKKRS
ncbi:Crp/Fnr family transcriptional regulator [Paraflavisolibacter sp. H34]|uniref:Crp/Fnr family transcriptional regulator n=1 Tax=Huijunlia imazamoxiresistens TaxID=3127457 RepID=UPI003018CA58